MIAHEVSDFGGRYRALSEVISRLLLLANAAEFDYQRTLHLSVRADELDRHDHRRLAGRRRHTGFESFQSMRKIPDSHPMVLTSAGLFRPNAQADVAERAAVYLRSSPRQRN
jgi:hypothetical protein